ALPLSGAAAPGPPGPLGPAGPGPDSDLSRIPTSRHRSGPLLLLKLFVTGSYEQRRSGPCVITADHRIYVEVGVSASLSSLVRSCMVSPHSDPKKSPFWFVIREGCSSDPSVALEGAEEELQPLRFSFILRSVYNNSMQFLHCSLHLCVSDSTRRNPTKEAVKDCKDGLRIPALQSRSPRHQVEKRTAQQMVQIGPMMGIVFAAFVMGVTLMGGLWCIYNHTGNDTSFLLSLTSCGVNTSSHHFHKLLLLNQ
uniref:ZP domain-containing protein n=1 Tax=Monopterus albus TaxID=43700 RepID=A0A3Q3IJI2_MONAL